MNYAIRHHHWVHLTEILDHIRTSPNFSRNNTQSLLDRAVVLWANAKRRRSDHFSSLLEWGANPNILFEARWEFTRDDSNTLFHSIRFPSQIDALISHGFSKLNHLNSGGATPIMKLAEIFDSHILHRAIGAGCVPDYQDFHGRTALHHTVEAAWERFNLNPYRTHHLQTSTFECTEVLLRGGSDPNLGDFCRCACSRIGCTPVYLLMKSARQANDYPESQPLAAYLWCFEWLEVILTIKGYETAKICLQAMLRLLNFEALELTHTCCRKKRYKTMWDTIDEDEVDEIMEEEKEMIEDLDRRMDDLEQSFDVQQTLEDIWMKELPNLVKARSKRVSTAWETILRNPTAAQLWHWNEWSCRHPRNHCPNLWTQFGSYFLIYSWKASANI